MKNGGGIYLDHQASTPVDPAVLERMLPFFSESFANPHSSDHAAGWVAGRAVEESAGAVAALVGADADEVIFTSGATESNNACLFGLRLAAKAGPRKVIITSRIEHKSTLAACAAMKREYGCDVQYVGVSPAGEIDLDHLREIISEQTLVVSCGGINSEIGTRQDVAGISEIAREYGALLHIDAAQMPAAGAMDRLCDVADFISLSGHKFYGPKGIGCLVVRRAHRERLAPLIFGGGQQQGLRSGTLPVALCVGVGEAARILRSRSDEQARLRALSEQLWEGLKSLGRDVGLNGPSLADRHPGNVSVRFSGFNAQDIIGALQPKLAVSTGSACTSGIPEPSHVLRAIGLNDQDARSSVRFGVGRFSTGHDVQDAVALVDAALRRLEAAGMEVA